jgi:hypothetical protein
MYIFIISVLIASLAYTFDTINRMYADIKIIRKKIMSL